MNKKKLTHYEIVMTVEGRGTFPVDMLRYDSACPKTERDSNEIDRASYDAPRKVELRRFCRPGMNERSGEPRWNSCGWKIVSITYPCLM